MASLLNPFPRLAPAPSMTYERCKNPLGYAEVSVHREAGGMSMRFLHASVDATGLSVPLPVTGSLAQAASAGNRAPTPVQAPWDAGRPRWLEVCTSRWVELRSTDGRASLASVAADLWEEVGTFDPYIAAEMEHESGSVPEAALPVPFATLQTARNRGARPAGDLISVALTRNLHPYGAPRLEEVELAARPRVVRLRPAPLLRSRRCHGE